MRWPIRNQILVPLLAVAIVSLTAVGAINTVLTERRRVRTSSSSCGK